jgi:hypothetical protein
LVDCKQSLKLELDVPNRLCAAVFAAAVATAPVAARAMGDEEFVGPFPSWANVKTNYDAVGDGVTDDTVAIQKALDALGPSNPTLYFPPGTYRISQTLTLARQQYVNIIGQDPSNTVIIWAGASGDAMLHLNGIAYSRVDRLAFNGQGNAAIAIDQSWIGSGNYFDSANEYADDIFENAGIGLRCGNLGAGCAETSMLRDHFINNKIGIITKNFNALDVFIWYSLFQNNNEGVSNSPGAGNFHVYNSVFQNSTSSDITIGNTGVFNFRNNYTTASKHFLYADATNNPANIFIAGNTILDTANPTSIAVADLGPVILLDNTIRSLATVTSGPVVRAAGWSPTDLFSMGNTFTVSTPTYANGHYHAVQDQVVARSTINPSPPILPGTPPNNHRQIFEVTPSATTAQIQAAINNAAASGTVKPVVHIQAGLYSINATLVVPAGSDLQIIGDGYYSRLMWSGSGAGPVMRLLGPSKATLRDLSVSGNNYSADGIEVDNADQPGSRVFMEQANPSLSRTNLFVDGLDYTNVELHDFYAGYGSLTGTTNASVVVTAGPSAAAGLWQGGATNIFAGAASGNYVNYNVSNGAHFSVQAVWNDACCSQVRAADVTGTSTFTYAGSAINLPSGASVAISLNNFQGTAALVNLGTNAAINITGASGTNAKVLGLGLVGQSSAFFSDIARPSATTGFLVSQTTANHPPGVATAKLPQQGTADVSLLSATLNQIRTGLPTLLAPVASGVTDARFYRVFVDHANTGIHLKAALAAAPSVTNGSCGESNGTNLTVAPTTGLCNAGTASSVSGKGPWTWFCVGSNGGSTASCSAQLVSRRHRHVR